MFCIPMSYANHLCKAMSSRLVLRRIKENLNLVKILPSQEYEFLALCYLRQGIPITLSSVQGHFFIRQTKSVLEFTLTLSGTELVKFPTLQLGKDLQF